MLQREITSGKTATHDILHATIHGVTLSTSTKASTTDREETAVQDILRKAVGLAYGALRAVADCVGGTTDMASRKRSWSQEFTRITTNNNIRLIRQTLRKCNNWTGCRGPASAARHQHKRRWPWRQRWYRWRSERLAHARNELRFVLVSGAVKLSAGVLIPLGPCIRN